MRAVVAAVWVWGHATGQTKWLAGRGVILGHIRYGMCERDSGLRGRRCLKLGYLVSRMREYSSFSHLITFVFFFFMSIVVVAVIGVLVVIEGPTTRGDRWY